MGKGPNKNKGGRGRTPQRPGPRAREQHKRKSITTVTTGQLPRWVRDEIVHSTPKEKREPSLAHLAKGLQEFADERYPAAINDLHKAKKLSPRSATIRELLGLSAYRSGRWEEALRELRTFRRLTGDLIHTPVELDCLRALGRKDDVVREWERLRSQDLSPSVSHEARVVYASFLLDEGRPLDAWEVIKPGRLISSPSPGELRRWYVAARVAVAAGDKDAARRILAALEEQTVDFEGVDELRQALA